MKSESASPLERLISAIDLNTEEVVGEVFLILAGEEDESAATALINTPDLEQNTAMHKAVAKGNKAVIDLLLRYRPNLQVTNVYSDTPFDIAVTTRNEAERLGRRAEFAKYSSIVDVIERAMSQGIGAGAAPAAPEVPPATSSRANRLRAEVKAIDGALQIPEGSAHPGSGVGFLRGRRYSQPTATEPAPAPAAAPTRSPSDTAPRPPAYARMPGGPPRGGGGRTG